MCFWTVRGLTAHNDAQRLLVAENLHPVMESRSKEAQASPEIEAPGGPSHRPGDLPPSLARRYFTERLRGAAAVALYEGPGAKRIALRDHGDRLTTDQSHPAVIRDMSLIAAHRGWSAVRVRGQDEFRREAWLQARVLGSGFATVAEMIWQTEAAIWPENGSKPH